MRTEILEGTEHSMRSGWSGDAARAGFRRVHRRARVATAALVAISVCTGAWSPALASTPLLNVTGMTFVASRDVGDPVVLKAVTATFDTDAETAHLNQVEAMVPSGESSNRFEMTCDESDVDLATNDFIARGNVVGRTDQGLRFSTDRVDYDHAKGELSADTPVVITESGVSYRGGGFRYLIREGHFSLRGGASVVQESAEVKAE